MEGLTSGLIGQLTAGSLLLIVVFLVMIGKIVPRSALDDVRAIYEARMAELRDEVTHWREAHRASEEVRVTQRETIREAMELARLAEDALRGVRTAAAWAEQERRESGQGEPR